MITLIIILITAGVSILCFNGTLDIRSWVFNAYQVWHRKQWHRMLSYGLVHGGWGHLVFNMLTLYFFGPVVEQYFAAAFGATAGAILFVVLYVSAIAVSTAGDLVKYRDDNQYNALGASGAVSAILFASILFEPKMGIYIFMIPIPVPGYTAGTWPGGIWTTSATPPISGVPSMAWYSRCSASRPSWATSWHSWASRTAS